MFTPSPLRWLHARKLSQIPTHFTALRSALRSQTQTVICLLLVWTLVCQTLTPTQWRVQGKATSRSVAESSGARTEESGWLTQLAQSALPSVFGAAPAPVEPPVYTLTDAVISRGSPNIQSGQIEGALRVLQGQPFAIGGSPKILGDVYLPGSASIQLNGGAQHGGVVNDGGAASSNYVLTLSGGIVLPGKIHTNADAVPLPSDFPTSVPSAAGLRTVSVNSQSDIAAIGEWQTVRDLSVTKSGLTINVPPGNYGTFTVNGNSRLNFTPGVYNFANTFNLDGSASLQATGLVTINVAQNLTINSGSLVLGSFTAPGDVRLNVLGSSLRVNGSSQVSGMVRAYNGMVTLNGTSLVRGQVIANNFTLNGGRVIAAVWPAHTASGVTTFGPRRFDRTTGQPNQYLEQFSLPAGITSPYQLHIQNGSPDGSNRVSSATIKLNGTEILIQSDLNQNVAFIDRTVSLGATNTLEVRLTSNPGSYLIINIGGEATPTDTSPPSVAITAPSNNTTTTSDKIDFSGTATDTGTPASGVAHVYVNGVESTFNAANSTWSISDVPLEMGANQITVRAVDEAGNESTTSINVTREAPNHAPTVNAGVDQTFALPQSATLHGTASDDGLPAGSSLSFTWSVVSNPGSVAFTGVNSLDATATFGSPGTYVLRLTASDGDLSTSDDITLTVEPENQPPTVNAGPDQTIALPRTATLNGTVTDDGLPANSVISLLWEQVSGPGVTTFEDPLLSETVASFSTAGTYVLRLTATDSVLTASSEVTITVHPENQAPTAAAGVDQTISLPATAQLNGSAADDGWPYGSTLTTEWSVVSGPGSVVFANPNVTVTSASVGAPGTYILRLTANDGELTTIDDVVVIVTPPNQAPVVSAGTDQTITLPAAATLAGTITDDGLPLGSSVSASWSRISGPGEVTFNDASQSATTVQFSAPGEYVLRLTASDGALTASDELVITVIPENHAPVVGAGADQTITLPSTASLNGSVSDDGLPAGSTLATTWSKVSGPGTVTFGNPNVTVTTAAFSESGSYVLRLTATDSNLSTNDELTITVIPQNFGPTVDAGGDQTIALPAQAILNGSATDDGLPAGSTLTTTWSKVSGPGTVTFANPNAAVTTAAFSEAGTYVLLLTASDSDLSDSDELVVTVEPENQAPVVNAGTDQTITLPALATLNGTAMDDGWPRNSSLNVVWSQVSGPGTSTFATPNAAATSVSFSVAGSYVLRLTATDSALTTSDDVTVTVIPENHAPSVNAGADQTITLPNSVSLIGDASDDGLPAGNTLITTWSKVSGPGTVTFANANAPVTTAAFSEAGSYVLRLTATDSEFTVSDEIGVVAIPENHAPTANAGADQTITLPEAVNLNGSASDDGLPSGSTLTTTWTKVSGPGDVVFSSPGTTATSATFCASGTYVLRLTATDSQLSGSDELTVTVRKLYTQTFQSGNGEIGQLDAYNVASRDGGITYHPAYVVETYQSWLIVPGTNFYWETIPGTKWINWQNNYWAAAPFNWFTTPTVTKYRLTFTLPADYSNPALFGRVAADERVTVRLNGTQVGQFYTAHNPGGLLSTDDATLFHAGENLIEFDVEDLCCGTHGFDYRITISANTAAPHGNQAPAVKTAPDQTISWPNGTSVSGSVADDGLPCNSPMNISWSKVSGPGTVTFANANATSTAVTFSATGTYLLRLSGSDGQLTSTDDIKIVVQPPNQAPVVNAGTDQVVRHPDGVSLNGTVTDDGLPSSAVSATWSKQSGPGDVTFANANATATSATFTVAGVYVLRLAASDSDLSAFDELTVAVNPLTTACVNDDFTDDFDDNSLNSGKWTIATPSSTVAVFERNQRLELVLQPNKIDYNGIHSLSTFDLRGKGLQVEVKEPTSQSGYTETYLMAAQDANNYFLMDAGAGSFALDSYTAGVRDRTVISYNATTHRFWRLRHVSADNKVHFETSTDGLIWTTRKTVTATFALNAIRIQLMAGAWGTGNNVPGKAVFDNLRLASLYPNCVPSVTLTSPAPNATFATHSNIGLEATASDTDGSVNKVEFFSNGSKIGEALASPYTFVWSDVAAGTYSLTARVIDDKGATATSSPVQITVISPNQAPTSNAGADQAITACTANLQGAATDDGFPAGSTLTIAWSKVSGPGDVSFSNATNLNTSAAFSLAGNYVLRLTASDSELSTTDDIAVSVNPIPNVPAHYIDPTPYLSFQDSPFKNLSLTYFYRDDFEDHLLNTPGVTANTGGATSVVFGPGSHDSVDADDGLIDGHSTAGDSYYSFNGNAGLKFTFNASVLGSLPTHVGAVWTDGAGTVSFEVFDRNGVSKGLRGPFNIADGVFSDTTAEDRFVGAYDPQGISAIRILNTSGGIEIDHLQYGFGNGNNAAPVVNAGADQTLVLPVSSATLNGIVNDDGLPGCATVAVSWSQVSGPGTVTFASPNAVATTASFSGVGTYVLRLTANDTQLSSSDDVTITVANPQAPGANFTVPESTGTAGAFVIASSGFTSSAFSADKVLDDSFGTFWNAPGSTNQFATIQFFDQQNVFIDRVRMQSNQGSVSPSNVKDFEVKVSSTTLDSASFVTVLSATMLNNGQLQEFVFPGGPARAKYLQLVMKNNYGATGSTVLATFNSVAVGSADSLLSLPGLANVARSQSPALIVNGSSIHSASYGSGANSADGILGYGRGGFVTNGTTNEFAIIQLGGATSRDLKGVRLATWYDAGFGSSTAVKDFEVWVSNTTTDLSSFTKVLTATAAFVGPVQTFMFPGGPVPARYVKYVPLTKHGGGTSINTVAFDVIVDDGARLIAASSENQNGPLPAVAAFDGDTTTPWYSQQGQFTNQWVKTALADDKIQKVFGFRIYPSNTVSSMQGPKDIEIRVSTTTTDDAAFTTVYTGTLPAVFSSNPQEIFLNSLIDARYVQFFWKNGYSTSFIGVRELEVLAAPDRGAAVVAAGAANVETLLDLDPSSNPWQTPLNQNSNVSFTLLLERGVPRTINHIAFRPAIASNGNFSAPKDFLVQVSTTDAADASFTTVLAGTLVSSIQLQDLYFTPVQAKYVRVVIVKGNDFGSFALHNFLIYASDAIGTTTRFLDRSTDPDGQVVSWSWNFGDGTTSLEKNPIHTFAQPGDYTVSLTATDDSGLTNTYTNVYHVVESVKTDFAISPAIAHEGGENVRFTDLGDLLTFAGGQRRYNWGDGSAPFTQNTKTSLHTYQDSGVFHVTLNVDDVLGVRHTVTKDITVVNMPPTVAIDPGKTLVWGQLWTSVPQINDQSSVDRVSLQGQWNFGDGQTSNCTNCTNANATVTHAYALPGSYRAVLTITDKDGGVGSDSADFVINKRPTKLVFTNPPAQTNNEPLIIQAQLIDTFANVPLSGKLVQFTLNGASFSAVTAANGVAQVSVSLPAGTKVDIITGSFAEDEFYLACGGVAVPPTAGSAPPEGTLGNQGTNFWLMFPHAFFDGNLAVQRLYISSRVATSGTVTIPGGGFNFTQNFTVQANAITTVQLPFVQVYESDIIQAKGIHITSQQPVTVYGLNQRVFTSDAYLALPVNALGTDHHVLTYGNISFAPTSEFGIVASENATTVTITPAVTTGSRMAGVPYNITLNQGQTYLLQNTVPTAAGDLTGSRVQSDKPIAVFAGHAAATLPAEPICCADHLVEQLTPINSWGKRFATIPIATRIKGDFFRFIASQDGTQVYLNGNLTAILNRGEWAERTIKDPAEIISTAPIMVAQYSTSIGYDPPVSGKADPFQMIVPPYSQFLNHYTVSTPGTGFAINYANVVAPTASLGSITLDGTAIPASSFTPIGVSGYSGAQIPISVGTHNFDGPASFGVSIYGYSQDEGYGYPAGMNTTATIQAVNVTLAPETQSRPITNQACVVASVTNQDQLPLGGRTINFTVTGSNPSNSSATTDAAGVANFCYSGTNLGSDLVTATVGTAAGTASIQWQTDVPNQPPSVNAGGDQAITLPAPASLQGSANDDGLPFNTLTKAWSKLSGPGNVTFANSSQPVTTATFDADGVYVLRLTASDGALSTIDDVQVTVNPIPVNQQPTANAGPDLSAAIKGNLIVNPGNELPLVNGEIPGWKEEQGTTWTQGNSSIAGLPEPHIGQNFFYVGADGVQYAELRQDIDVSALAATIATGAQQFEFQTWVRAASEFPYPDNPQIIVEFRNSLNNAVIATMSGGNSYAINFWHLTEAIQAAPVGTGWIRVRLIGTRTMNGLNDAYFDSISLRPVGNAAAKLNGTVTDDGLPYGSSVSATWTKLSGPGQVTFSNANVANSGASFTVPGTYVLRLTASDGQASTSDDVTVLVNPVNQRPTVNAGVNQTITLPASVTLNGIVNDDGLPQGSSVSVRWKLDSGGPGTVTFANPNAASTTASFSAAGTYALILTAADSEYSASDVMVVNVNAAPNQPPTVNPGPNQTISLPTDTVTMNGVVTDDGLPAGSTLTISWTKVSGPGNVTFGSPNSAVTTAQFSAIGNYVLRLSASDGAYLVTHDVGVILTPQNFPPAANAGPDQTSMLSAGAQLDGSASDDGLPAGGNLTTSWSQVSGPGTVTFLNANVTVTGANFSAIGTYVLRLTANDSALTSSDDITITVIEDVAPPTVAITAPTDGASVTQPTLITGSVSGGAWTLEYSLGSDDNANNRVWTTFATGNGATSGTLGTLDPTNMLNGLFTLRLSATDPYGQTTRTSISTIIEGNLKVGNFTVSFTDLSIPVAGVPMEVTRTYDTRDKRVGDFGFGWTMGLRNIRVEKSGVIGLKWYETASQEVFPNYCLQPLGSNIISVTFPDGKVFKFKTKTTPECQRFAPITGGTVSFTPLPGTHGTLQVIGSADFQIDGSVPGPVNLIGFGGGVDIFNSFVFKFTAEDGTAYVIDQRTGLQSIADLSGNTVTIGAGGIVHSNGKSITFTRDSLGRITSMTDPGGNSQTYSYDANGDLVSHTDAENNTSTFTYDATHRLLTINDPRGIQPIRNDYDADGRLISHTDGFGKVFTYNHDLVGRIETLTDRLGHTTTFEYDGRGNVLRKTDARGGVTSFTYDANDNVLTETNAIGKTTTYTYDALDHRTSITDPLGNLTQFTYNGLGKLLTTTDPLGRVTTNTYNGAGKLLTTKDALNNETTYTYSIFDGQLISSTSPLNGTSTYTYTGGYLTKAKDPLGNETTFAYDANGNRASQTFKRTNAQGQVETFATSYEHDKLSRLKKTTFPDSSFAQIEYNAIGQKAATIDQSGRRTEFTYDVMGRLTRTTYPNGEHEDATYDAEGRRLTATDRAGHVTSYHYDELGRLTKTTFADGTFMQTAFDSIGRVSSTTDSLGHITTYEYDPNCGCSSRRSKITDSLGHITTFAYDAAGRQTSVTDSLNHTMTFEYDELGRRVKTIYPDSTFDMAEYNAMGQVIKRTDQAGKSTQFAFDAVGNLIKVTDALGQETRYVYDELGEQTEQTDALGHTTRYEYDKMGRRTKRTLPLGQFETYAYASDGLVTSRTDFNGKTTTYSYDTMGRLITKTPDASLNQPLVTFTYSQTNRRLTMQDASGVTSYSYDIRDRLINKQTPQGTLSYTYNDAGDLLTTRSSNSNGVSLDYGYDALNRLSTVKDNNLAALNGGVTTYSFDAVGNLQGYQNPNGVGASYTYNSLNRLTSMTTGTGTTQLASYSYTLGPTGTRTAVTELGGRSVTYNYDDLYRLTSESIGNDPQAINGSISYGYDAVGNRLSRSSTVSGLPSQTASYDANDRLASANYDNNGNTLATNGNNYAYDFEDRLSSASGGVAYVYDGDGNRVSKTVGGVTTRYLIDTNNHTGLPQVVDEINSGVVTRSYAGGLGLISQRQIVGSQWEVSFYGFDGQGSVRQLTDASGSVTDTYTYDAFGNVIARTGTTPNERLYVGAEQFDANLGFYFLRARYMDPSSGRFMTQDTYEGDRYAPMSLHKYLYANASPTNFSDPTGHMSIAGQVAAIAVAGIIASIAIFARFTHLSQLYLPKDAFQRDPDGVVFGFQVAHSVGRNVPLRNPFTLGLRLGLWLLAGVYGADALVPFANPGTAWLYAYGGLSSGLGQHLASGTRVTGYVGFVWNVSQPGDYAGSVFCSTLTPHSLSPGLGISSSYPVSVCSSPPKDSGKPGAYSVIMNVAARNGARSRGTLQASGTSYHYLHDLPFGQAVPRTIQGAENLWQTVSKDLEME